MFFAHEFGERSLQDGCANAAAVVFLLRLPGVSRSRSAQTWQVRPQMATHSVSVSPPAGFGKDVNDFLLRHVTLADAKAGATSSIDFAVSGLLIASLPDGGFARAVSILAAALLIASLISGIAVIFPRTAVDPKGVIYWEGILTQKSFEDYFRHVTQIDQGDVEREYAAQNWAISQLLVSKYQWTQRGIWLLLAGMLVALLSFGVR
jgi:hypothetical protein